MFIKLTNSTKEHEGKALIINSKFIVSVFPVKEENGDEITIVYGALKESWSVKETVDEINEMLAKETA